MQPNILYDHHQCVNAKFLTYLYISIESHDHHGLIRLIISTRRVRELN